MFESVSGDCNSNGVPDECDPDADADGLPDGCCLDDAGCADADPCSFGQCIDQWCELSPTAYGDVNHDEQIDIFDILCVLDGFQGDFSSVCRLQDVDIAGEAGAECVPDGRVDLFDIFSVLDAFTGVDACCSAQP